MNKPPLLAIRNLSYAYGQARVLENIDLDLPAGRFYGLVGPNGCGKTTFLDLLTGTKNPLTGDITLLDKPLANYNKRELARKIALVPQEFDTGFGFSVEEIVLMGRHPHIDRFAAPNERDWQAVEQAIEAIGIAKLRQRTLATLSGGQKQRAIVARALAQETPVLFFDEATSSLDVKYTLQIFNLARKLVRDEGRTILAVIHNLNLAAAFCDYLIFMKEGKVAEYGPTTEVLTEKTIGDVFGVTAKVAIDSYNQIPQISFQYFS